MKICVIGAGAQGSIIARILVEDPEFDEVVLADINMEILKRATQKINNTKLTTERIDAGDPDDLAKLLKGASIAINATLTQYNLAIFNSALKCGAHYIDFAEDWPVREKFLQQLQTSDKWKKAELTALKHQGITPGVTNVLARYAADQLDRVDEIHIKSAWWMPSKREGGLVPKWSPGWSVETALLEWAANPIVYEDGEYKTYPPFSGVETHAFPEPMGSHTVCLVEHEEVVTLPDFIGKGVKYVDFKMTPDIIAGILVNMGLVSTKPIEVGGAKVKPLDVVLKLAKPAIEQIEEIEKSPEVYEIGEEEVFSSLIVQAMGERDGKSVEEYVYLNTSVSDMDEWLRRYDTTNGFVPIPAAAAAKMLATGEIQDRGVIVPECLEPEPFLKKTSEMGLGVFKRITKKQVG
jgi:saccharopine dehydrogenase (NAD+, L-lysine-forming)